MKRFLLSVSILALAVSAGAQNAPIDGSQFDTPKFEFDKMQEQSPRWIRSGVAGVTLSQTSLSNWSAGGEGSLAFNAMLNYDALYTNRRHMWQNRLELAYGMNITDSKGNRKTNDKIFLSSMYGYRISKTWYASMLGIFSTQFAKGYDYSTASRTYMSRFMAPGYVSLGAGFTWRPRTWFNAYLSPATWRGTFVFDDRLFQDAAGKPVYYAYGVKPGRHLYNEFGANVRLEFNRDLWSENFHVYSRLDLFSNYLHKPQNIDVRWYLLASARINKWLAANFTLNVLYDDDIKFLRSDGTLGGSKLQVKQILGVGLQTTF